MASQSIDLAGRRGVKEEEKGGRSIAVNEVQSYPAESEAAIRDKGKGMDKFVCVFFRKGGRL